jgi:hypothetical protein
VVWNPSNAPEGWPAIRTELVMRLIDPLWSPCVYVSTKAVTTGGSVEINQLKSLTEVFGRMWLLPLLAGTRPGSFVDGEFIIDTELVGGGPGGVIETPGQVILTFEATVSGSSIAPEPTYLALVVSGIGIGAAVLTRHLASATITTASIVTDTPTNSRRAQFPGG